MGGLVLGRYGSQTHTWTATANVDLASFKTANGYGAFRKKKVIIILEYILTSFLLI